MKINLFNLRIYLYNIYKFLLFKLYNQFHKT